MIRRSHRRGMRVFVWTINDPVQMSVMLSRGVDGLITDEPALARRVDAIHRRHRGNIREVFRELYDDHSGGR